MLLDYTTPDYVQQIDDVGAVVIALTALIGLIVLVGKAAIWLDKRKDDRFAQRVMEVIVPVVKDIVEEATSNIQTYSNGGFSLSDLHERLDGVEQALGLPTKTRPTEGN